MSSIEKLSIQGIRSFGPDDKEKQVIQFFAPLTLILGPNGTGKTTIIECLKYMTTGEMPPGSKGGAFVHDPKIAHETEVKGQIRLQLRDVRDQQCVVQRIMTATQKAKMIQMKTLEGVITRRDATGQKHSVSQRCADINKEMVSLLGVSKAVLDNVIFCHQEDSNWPLSEGKALKQKFDDIFASTRYVKALEVIRKFRQEQNGMVREYQAEMKYLKMNKEKAASVHADLAETEARYVASKETVKKVKEKLEPIDQKLTQLGSNYQDIHKLHSKIEKLTGEKDEMEKGQDELRKNIDNEFNGSTEELRNVLSEFKSKVKEREASLQGLERDLQKLESKKSRLSEEKSKILMEVGKLEQEAEMQRDLIKNRNSVIQKNAQKHNIEGFSGPMSDKKVKEFLTKLEDIAKGYLNEAKSNRAEYEKQEEELQEKINDARSLKTKSETEVRIKQENLKKNRMEIKEIDKELNRVEASAERLCTVERDLKRAEQEYKEAEEAYDIESLKGEVSSLQGEKKIYDSKLKELNAEVNRMHLESTTRTQLEMYRKEKGTKEDQIKRLRNKNEEGLVHVLGHMPADNLRRALEKYTNTQSQAVKQDNTKLQQFRMELSKKETDRGHTMEQLASKEEEMRGLEKRIFDVCESQNFDAGLSKLEEKIKHAHDTKGLLLGSKTLFDKYVNTLSRNEDPPCPLCHRPFDGNSEVQELVTELSNKLTLIPDKLETVTQNIDDFQSKFNNMLQLKPSRDTIKNLTEADIPNLKTKLKVVNEQIDKIRNSIADKEEELDSKQLDEATAKSMHSDMVQIDRLQNELKDLDRKIAQQTSKLSGGDSGKTMQQVTSEQEDVQMNLETLNRKLDSKRQKISEQSERIQQLKASVNEHKAEKLQIESDLQQQTRLTETKAELISANEAFEREIRDAKEQLQPLGERITKLTQDREKITQKKEDKYESDKEQFNKIKELGKDVQIYQKKIDRYLEEGKDEILSDKQERRERIEQEADRISEQSEEKSTNVNKIRKDLATQKVRERELHDNMLLRKKQEDIDTKTDKISEINEKLGGLDVKGLDKQMRDFRTQQENLIKEKHTSEGRLNELEMKIRGYKQELKTDYKDADKNYREKMITLRTTELANTDLDKYYKALDRTIMNYHSMKMEEINKIIRELWRNTYRGHDIETIEIRSDEDEGSGAAKTRRTYNYRVVMIKGDAVLDMRGRCSAGQKVLASLIIRLALAETFCLNCGILALDEPTTNLDRENIESLAFALVEIIKSRSKQKNFQLIAITHDEDFVDLLGRSQYVDEFYKVRKDQFGCSQLVKAKVEDLHR